MLKRIFQLSRASVPLDTRADLKAPTRPFQAVLPVELWDQVLSHCDDRSFANMMNVCVGMRNAPSGNTFRARIESLNKKAFCPVLPRETLAANYNAFVRGNAHLVELTRDGPLLLDDTAVMRYGFFSPNSMFVVAEMTYTSSVRVFDLRGNQPIRHTLHAFEGATCIQSVAFSTDSKRVFISSTWGGEGPHVSSVYALDEEVPRLVVTIPTEFYFTRAAFSPDGSKLAIGSQHDRIALWNFDENTTTTLPGVNSYAYAIEFSPDGKRLVVGGSHRADGDIFDSHGMTCVWDVAKSEPCLTHTIQQERWVGAAHWSPDSTHLLIQTPEPHEDLVWDVTSETASPVDAAPHEEWVEKRRHGEHDFYAGARNNAVEISDITARPATILDHRTSNAHVMTTNVSPSGRFVVTTDSAHDRAMRLYDGLVLPMPAYARISQRSWIVGVMTGLLGG